MLWASHRCVCTLCFLRMQARVARSADPEAAFPTASPASCLPQMLHMSPHLAAFNSAFKAGHPPQHSNANLIATSQQHVQVESTVCADQSKAEHFKQLASPEAARPEGQAQAEDDLVHEQQSGSRGPNSASQSTLITAEEQQTGQQVLPAVAENSAVAGKPSGLQAPLAHATAAASQHLSSATADKLQRSHSSRPSLAVLDHPERHSVTAVCAAEAVAENSANIDSGTTEQLASDQPEQPAEVQLASGSTQLIQSEPIEQQAQQAEAQVVEKPDRRSRRMTRSAARGSLAASSGREDSGQTGNSKGNSKRQHAKSLLQLSAIPEAADSAVADTGRSQRLSADAVPLACHHRDSSTALLATVREVEDAAADEPLAEQTQVQARQTVAGQDTMPACTGPALSSSSCQQTAQAADVGHLYGRADSVTEVEDNRQLDGIGAAGSTSAVAQQAKHAGTQHAQQPEAQQAEHVSSVCEPASNAQPAPERDNGAASMQEPQHQGQGKEGRSKRPPKPRQPLEPTLPAGADTEPARHAGCHAEPAMPASSHAEHAVPARDNAEHPVPARADAEHAVPARADAEHAVQGSCQAEHPSAAAAHFESALPVNDAGEAAGQSSDAGMLETAAVTAAPTTYAASEQVQWLCQIHRLSEHM